MKISEAIEILETYNQWRRGAEIPQPHPMQIGIAIDTVIDFYNNILSNLELNKN